MVLLAEAAAFAHAFIRNTSITRAPCLLIEPQARVALGLIAGHDVKSPTIGKVDPCLKSNGGPVKHIEAIAALT
jgi:hypothetical protein